MCGRKCGCCDSEYSTRLAYHKRRDPEVFSVDGLDESRTQESRVAIDEAQCGHEVRTLSAHVPGPVQEFENERLKECESAYPMILVLPIFRMPVI